MAGDWRAGVAVPQFPLGGWVPQEELGVRISKTLHLQGFPNQKQIERMLTLSAVHPWGGNAGSLRGPARKLSTP